MENLTVKQFCEHFEKLNSEDAKQRYVKSVIKRTYAPFVEKMALCKQAAEKSLHISQNGKNYIDMCANKLDIVTIVISLYTTLVYDQIESKNIEGIQEKRVDIMGGYDALKRTDALSVILSIIGPDIEELLFVNEKCLENINEQYCSFEFYISEQLNSLAEVGKIVENLIVAQNNDSENK